jgi:hypothetical protein
MVLIANGLDEFAAKNCNRLSAKVHAVPAYPNAHDTPAGGGLVGNQLGLPQSLSPEWT